MIGFELPRAERVKLEVFDLQGRLVRSLADGPYSPGSSEADWDGRDAAGRKVPPGIYLYRMAAGAFHAQRKLAVMP